jgi:alpha-N-acetylglucosamine transferase
VLISVRYSIYGRKRFILPRPNSLLKAIVTNVQNELYIPHTLVLGHTLQKNSVIPPETHLVALLPIDHTISPASLSRLKKVGWTIRFEHDLSVPGIETPKETFQSNFIKLRIWSWVEYAKIAWIDADCIVLGDMSHLLSDSFGKTAINVH